MIGEIDEKHSRAIEEIREQSNKALEEIMTIIAGIALQNTEVASRTQLHTGGSNQGILDTTIGNNGHGHYTKLEFSR